MELDVEYNPARQFGFVFQNGPNLKEVNEAERGIKYKNEKAFDRIWLFCSTVLASDRRRARSFDFAQDDNWEKAAIWPRSDQFGGRYGHRQGRLCHRGDEFLGETMVGGFD